MVLKDPVLEARDAPAADRAASAPGVTAGRRAYRRSLSAAGGKIAVLACAVALWWVLTALHVLPSFAVPTPSAVVSAAESSWRSLLAQAGGTAEEVLVAIGAIWAVGVTAGVLIGMTPRLWPLLGLGRALYAVPIVVVYPLLSVWFGVGPVSKVVFGFVAGVIPMSLMCAAAVRSVDDSVFLLFSSLGASRMTMFRRGVLPAALPGVVGAMRLSGSLGLVSVIIGEMLLASKGVGYWIANAATQFEGPDLYAGVIVVLVFALAINGLVGFFEQRISRIYG